MKRFVINFKKAENKVIPTLTKFYEKVGLFSFLERRDMKVSISDVHASEKTINKIKKVIERAWCNYDISLDGEKIYSKKKRGYRDFDEFSKKEFFARQTVSSLELMFLSYLPRKDNSVKENELLIYEPQDKNL